LLGFFFSSFLDTNGDQQIAPKYSELGDFHEGLAFYKKP